MKTDPNMATNTAVSEAIVCSNPESAAIGQTV